MSDNKELIFPAPLKKGDKIVFCSPAGTIKPKKVEKAVEVLRAEGLKREDMPHA